MVIRGSGTSVFVRGGANEPSTRISVRVPEGTSLIVDDVEGKVTIGDTLGSLQAMIKGSTDISAGSISSATLTVQGSGDVDIKKVNGPVQAVIQGSGDVTINDGNVTALEFVIQGSGNA